MGCYAARAVEMSSETINDVTVPFVSSLGITMIWGPMCTHSYISSLYTPSFQPSVGGLGSTFSSWFFVWHNGGGEKKWGHLEQEVSSKFG